MDWKCGYSVLMPAKDRNSFDYVMIPTQVSAGTDTPETFGGYSGGGLWHTPLTDGTDDIGSSSTLCGVAFWQSAARHRTDRLVRCHFYRSIYERLFDLVDRPS
jgi:hypothetical protein